MIDMKPHVLQVPVVYCAFSCGCVLSATVLIVFDLRTPGNVQDIVSELITNNIKGKVVFVLNLLSTTP
jgi:hypothetical protein